MLIFLCKALTDEVKLSPEHTDFDWVDLEHCQEKLTDFYDQEIDRFNQLELHKHV